MLDQELIKKHHIDKLDKAETKQFVNKVMKAPWLSIYEAAVEPCIDMIAEHAPAHQKKFKFPKEKCDAKYAFFSECLLLKAFNVSTISVLKRSVIMFMARYRTVQQINGPNQISAKTPKSS
jgi:hypothetical protein